MKPNLYSLSFVFTLGGLLLINIASVLPASRLQNGTSTPAVETPIPLAGTAGDTNGIAFLGILIFVVIVVAIVIRLREAEAEPASETKL